MKKKIFLVAVMSMLVWAFTAHAAPVDKQIYYTKKTTLTYPKTYTMRFSIWDAASSGTMVWSEEKSIQLKNPKIATYLGNTTPFGTLDFSQQLWVQVERWKGSTSTWVQVGTTRDRLGVVPYALWSESSPSSSGDITGVTAGTGLTGGGTSGDVTLNANIGTAAGTVAAGNHTHSYDSTYVNVTGDTMTGTLNLPSNGLTAGTNQLVLSGGNVGIGTAAPNEQLEITGNLRLPDSTATTGIIKWGTQRYIHNYGTNNFFAGPAAGNLSMTGQSNTAIGGMALFTNTTGYQNTAIGKDALRNNTTGYQNTADGTAALYSNTTGYNNIAVGYAALLFNTTASHNTAVGTSALYTQSYNNGGAAWDSHNTALGFETLYLNQPTAAVNGVYNTALGSLALRSNTTGYGNTAGGAYALYSNSTGYYNTAIGRSALYSNNTGNENTAIGRSALYFNTTGNYNTASGVYALYFNSAGNYNTASGHNSLSNNTTASKNTVLGTSALYTQSYNNGGAAWDSHNTAVGFEAMLSNQPTSTGNGFYNTALGSLALRSNTTGYYNTAGGASALRFNTTANKNTALGTSALYTQSYNNGGTVWDSHNTAVGFEAMLSTQPTSISDGIHNTAFGSLALRANTTGYKNTAIGFGAGANQTTGYNNIYIGADVYGTAGESSVIRIGSGQTAAYIAGINGATSSGGIAVYVNASGQLGTVTSSRRFKEDIQDMGNATDNLMKLRPVTFYYKPEYSDGLRLLQYGLIAEEVAEVYPDLVQYNENGEPNTVYYQFVNAMLLNEVQKQHQQIETQQAEIDTLKARLEEIEALLQSR